MREVNYTPVTDIDIFLNDDFNIPIFEQLTEDKNFIGLFDPLDFFNLLYEQYSIVSANGDKPLKVTSHLLGLDLAKNELYYFLYYLLRLLLANHHPDYDLYEDPQLLRCHTFIEKEYVKLENELHPKEEHNTEQAASKYDFEIVKEYLKTLADDKERIIHLTKISTEYKQNESGWNVGWGTSFDQQCDLEIKKLEKLLALEQPTADEKANNQLIGYTNGQIVLIFHYFYVYCKIKGIVIDKTTLAKFIHLVVGKEFTTTTNSDIYNKLNKAPNFGGDKKLIENLEIIKPLFEKVKLDEIVKMINNELVIAHKEKANR